MVAAQRFLNPSHLALIARNVHDIGIGRFVMSKIGHNPRAQSYLFWPAFRALKLAKIARHPIEFSNRRQAVRDFDSIGVDIPWDDGFAYVKPYQLPNIEETLDYCRDAIHKWMKHYTPQQSDIASHILTEPDGSTDLNKHPILQKFVQAPEVLGPASRYLGEVPVLAHVSIQISHPNSSKVGFQQYHIDRIDRQQMKLFLAIDDVTADCGPLHFMPARESEELERREKHIVGRIEDDVVSRYAGTPGIRVGILKASEGLFLDTCRCVHFGSRGNAKPRHLLVIQYTSSYSPVEPVTKEGNLRFNPTLARATPGASLLYG